MKKLDASHTHMLPCEVHFKSRAMSSPASASDGLSIGDVARAAGIRPSAIRYYESVGLVPRPSRANGRRRYGPDTMRLIATLRFAQSAGFTVAEIRTLFHGFGADVPPAKRWQALAERKLKELDDLIANARRMKRAVEAGMGCRCLRIEDCLTDTEAGCSLPTPPLAINTQRRRR